MQSKNQWGDGVSERYQWQEHIQAPIFKKNMTPMEMEEFRRSLIKSYKCAENDIFTRWIPFSSPEDDKEKYGDNAFSDRDVYSRYDPNNYIRLVYFLKCIIKTGESPNIVDTPIDRPIFHFVIPIPTEIKQKYEQIKYQRSITNGSK